MYKRLLLPVILLSAALAAARDKPEIWIEIRSPHFVVVTNSTDRQARRVADQFERMRSVFQLLFPKTNIDPPTPIVVLAIRDEKNFRALEPSVYLAKGQLQLGGLFLHAADKNYVLMRLDAEGEHPYAVIYHEYSHLLLSKIDHLPLWLNEGIAEFYENSEIREKEVAVGEPSKQNLQLLHQYQLLPLPTLFQVDQTSPYYHEETKGSIFYGESWALTHYLAIKDFEEKTHRVGDYLQLIGQNVDAVAAAARAFGDLKQLQSNLDAYVRQPTFRFFKLPAVTGVDEASFTSRELPAAQADAVRADFLAYNQRTADARALLDHILHDDPNNALARETMGFMAYQEHHLDEARKWYGEAVKLDSQSYLAHYYFAAITMSGTMDAAEESQVETSLRASIKLNPNFAASYDRLAVFLARRHNNLDEARLMALTAIQLEPANFGYRINMASVLMQMRRPTDAADVLRNALRLAKTPQETEMAENFFLHVQQYAQAQERRLAESRDDEGEEEANTTAETEAAADSNPHDQPVPTGPHRFITGLLTEVRCTRAAMDLELVSGNKMQAMHANNYFRVQYSALGVELEKDLNPCTDLDGKHAKVEYIESETPNAPAAIIAIEIHK